MDVAGKTAIVTGAAGGIGAAVGRRLVAAGASVTLCDLDGDRLAQTVEAIGAGPRATWRTADVTSEAELRELIAAADSDHGPVDLFVANAGVPGLAGLDAPDAAWASALEVNLYAHIRAARLLMPGWVQRGSGYFISTASAAGLLTQIGAAPYSVSKHAAVAFAEWLAVTYGGQGITVSCLCPMGVDTDLYRTAQADPQSSGGARAIAASGAILDPEEIGEIVLEAIAAERFLILSHPEVAEFVRRKAADPDRWIAGMRRLAAETA